MSSARRATYTGEDVLNLICARNPNAPNFVVKKIWRYFVQDQPSQAVVDALAADFQKSQPRPEAPHEDVIFLSRRNFTRRMWSVRRSRVPVQWLIASTHQLQAPVPTQAMSLVMLRQLGQELFNPPNVKGWDGGIAWITTNNLLDRYNFAAALVEGDRVPLPGLFGQMRGLLNGMARRWADADRAQRHHHAVSPRWTAATRSSSSRLCRSRFLNADLNPLRKATMADFLKSRSPLEEADIRKAIRLIMCTPEYQLTAQLIPTSARL